MSDVVIASAIASRLISDPELKRLVEGRVKAGHVDDFPETPFPLITCEFDTIGRVLVQTKVTAPFISISAWSETSYSEAMVISTEIQRVMCNPISNDDVVIATWLIGTPVQQSSTEGESEARSYRMILKYGLGVAVD